MTDSARRAAVRRLRRLGHAAPGQPRRPAASTGVRRRPGRDGHPAQRRGARAGWASTVPAEATPNDMVVALRGSTTTTPSTAALAAVDARARGRRTAVPPAPTRGRAAAHHRRPRCGRTPDGARRWSRCPARAPRSRRWTPLDAGRDVMIFSDNVPVEQEVALKRAAAARGLLVMGPDCGTAVVGGLGLGFANVVAARPGRHRRRLRHRLPAAARAARPRRRRRHARRSASAVATCPPRSAGWPPARRCAGSTPTPPSS